jgi:hypothetical protein
MPAAGIPVAGFDRTSPAQNRNGRLREVLAENPIAGLG